MTAPTPAPVAVPTPAPVGEHDESYVIALAEEVWDDEPTVAELDLIRTVLAAQQSLVPRENARPEPELAPAWSDDEHPEDSATPVAMTPAPPEPVAVPLPAEGVVAEFRRRAEAFRGANEGVRSAYLNAADMVERLVPADDEEAL